MSILIIKQEKKGDDTLAGGRLVLNGRQYGGMQYTLTPPASQEHIEGVFINGKWDDIEAIGIADITLNNGIATISFSVKFTQPTSYLEDNFIWGVCAEAISEIGELPALTPVDGGFWEFYTYNRNLMGFGPSFKAQYDQDTDLNFWTFGKYDGNTLSDIVLLSSSQFNVGDIIHGTCYATYDVRNVNYGRIINGDILRY